MCRTADVVAVYRALVGVVTPRPIAWVTTVDADGRVNLAPFSFFNAFGANPPVVVFSPTLAATAAKKDTLRTLNAVDEFVLNAAVEDLAEAGQRDLERAAARPKRSRFRRSDASSPRPRCAPPRDRRVAGSPRVPGLADHVDRRRSDRGQPGDRRGAVDSHRRLRARRLTARSIPASCGRSPDWGATSTAGATDLFEMERP